jgi:hypothetical protein
LLPLNGARLVGSDGLDNPGAPEAVFRRSGLCPIGLSWRKAVEIRYVRACGRDGFTVGRSACGHRACPLRSFLILYKTTVFQNRA